MALWFSCEFSDLFKAAMKKAILDYALLSPTTCKRLKLDILNPFFLVWKAERSLHKSPLFVKIPEEWKMNYANNKSALQKKLHRCDPTVVSLRTVWMTSFAPKHLLKTVEELEQLMPLTISDFRQLQATEDALLGA